MRTSERPGASRSRSGTASGPDELMRESPATPATPATSATSTESPVGLDALDVFAEHAARIIEAVGIAILVIGVALATGVFLLQALRERRIQQAYQRYRGSLGRAILLSLEFLVAADIIGTVAVEPTLYNLGVLGIIVLIRTFLSFALEAEINGHWPWRESEVLRRQRGPEPGSPEAQKL